MSNLVIITKGLPSPNPVSIEKGKHLRFKSGDSTTYIVNAGEKDRILSHNFPLTVPSDGHECSAKIHNHAPKGTYAYSIETEEGKYAYSVGSQESVKFAAAMAQPPEMIVK